MHAPPDGYTLLLVGLSSAINATLYEKLNFIRDIAQCPDISINPVLRHATTTAGREPGASLAMHQFAVWRVSNGSKD
jgi:hypothetical protein